MRVTKQGYVLSVDSNGRVVLPKVGEIISREPSRVVDPFGGVGGCAFHAMLYGMHWTGVELEPKFYELGNQNLDLWHKRYGPHFPNYGTARLLQGDSRRLAEIVAAADGVVSSPPYAQSEIASRAPSGADVDARKAKRAVDDWSGYGTTPGQLGALPAGDFQAAISSPPYAETFHGQSDSSERRETLPDDVRAKLGQVDVNGRTYGDTPGQLGALPAGDFQAAISSPPYAGMATQAGDQAADPGMKWATGERADRGRINRENDAPDGYGATPGQLGNLPAGNFAAAISSPPYSETRIDGNGDEGASGLRDADGNYLRGHEGWEQRKAMGGRYGDTNGNLGNLPAGDFAAAVSSPPFGAPGEQPCASQSAAIKDYHAFTRGDGTKYDHQAITEGNLGNLRAGNFEAAVSSPPYAETMSSGKSGIDWEKTFDADKRNRADEPAFERIAGLGAEMQYGETPGQLGAENTETFWTAAREIVAQVYNVLQPGGVAAFITGDFVRNKKRVPFGEQWLALCESVGFELVAWATAWKTDDRGTQLGLLGDDKDLKKSKISFFRRLANEKNPDAAILNEDVIFVRRPA